MKQKIKLAIFFGIEFVAVAVILILVFFAGKKSYTVTFDLNGGTLLSGDLVQEVIQGGSATPPVVAKDGCFLHSWSTHYTKVTKDITVRAIWEYETTAGIDYSSTADSNYCEIVGAFGDLQGDVYIGAYHNEKKVLGIREGAFKNCTGITNVYMLEGIVSIGEGAFAGCTSLESVVLPSTLAVLGDSAFSGCASLASVALPEALKAVGSESFLGCESLATLKLGGAVSEIGDSAFSGCSALTSVSFPETLARIGQSAFLDCIELADVVLPSALEEIGAYAFSGCESFTKLEMPKSVLRIGVGAFDTEGLVINLRCIKNFAPSGWESGWATDDVTLKWWPLFEFDKEIFPGIKDPIKQPDIPFGDKVLPGVSGDGSELEKSDAFDPPVRIPDFSVIGKQETAA